MNAQTPHFITVAMDIEDSREVHTAFISDKDGNILLEADADHSPALYKFLVTICLKAKDHKMASSESGSNVIVTTLPADFEDKNWKEGICAGAFSFRLFEIAKETDVTGHFQTSQDDDGNFERMTFTK